MNQRRGLEGVVAALRAEVRGRNPAKIAVQAFDQKRLCLRISAVKTSR
jgi:hypothetical protein